MNELSVLEEIEQELTFHGNACEQNKWQRGGDISADALEIKLDEPAVSSGVFSSLCCRNVHHRGVREEPAV